MSIQLINQYYRDLERVKRAGQTVNETSIRSPFYRLLDDYCKAKNMVIVTEASLDTALGKKRPDGIIKDSYGINDWGYWESKDIKDDLDAEIQKKFNIGYPNNNILFENSEIAILYQSDQKVVVDMKDAKKLDKLLRAFVSYERPEIREFHQAIEAFKESIKQVVPVLQKLMEHQNNTNKEFVEKRNGFWDLCKNSINPEITILDIREMLIQHILTEDLFVSIFGKADFHRENNIARSLEEVLHTFYYGKVKQTLISGIRHYYETIRAKVSNIPLLSEKQKVLKIVYEEFYKAYNPKGADRLGVVYTPNEVVRFMIESTDYLTIERFGKSLSDEGVEILDPATGTGTFITDLLEFIPKHKLEFKYKNEIHCNELSILPYYIANLNIEYTYSQLQDDIYEPFENICFVDTLDNVFHRNATQYIKKGTGLEKDLFGSVSIENLKRIKEQNKKKISVIIGNPPYNANQQNWNDFNKNRVYKIIDKRIKDTYIAESTAQKTKVYDMYARFIRWASDRMEENGVVAFISNNSFLDTRTYDGFRKVIADEFQEVYILDLKGNARTSGERRKEEAGNIFTNRIKVGIAIYFLIRKKEQKGSKIYYYSVDDYMSFNEKLNFITDNKLQNLLPHFKLIIPTKTNDWINIGDASFDTYLPIVTKASKASSKIDTETLFKTFSFGVVTARDEWVYNFDKSKLIERATYFSEIFNETVKKAKIEYTEIIKWSRDLKNKAKQRKIIDFDENKIIHSFKRPYVKANYYSEKIMSDVLTSSHQEVFGQDLISENLLICITAHKQVPFCVQASNIIFDYGYGARDTYGIPFYRFDNKGRKIENITDWGLKQFQTHYNNKAITKENIFYYTYAVLHHPEYVEKFKLNLKKELPRIPYYTDFRGMSELGKELFETHLNFETAKPMKLKEIIKEKIEKPEPKLKADKDNNQIIIDNKLTLRNVPKQVWQYKLGNQSAVEWVLEQYKEKKVRDKSINVKIQEGILKPYKFADHKSFVVNLIKRICTISVKTVELINEIKEKK